MPESPPSKNSSEYQAGFEAGYLKGIEDKSTEYQEIVQALMERVSKNRRSKEISHIMYQISELSHDDSLEIKLLYEGICHALSAIIDTTNFFIARLDDEASVLEFVYYRDTACNERGNLNNFPRRPIGNGLTEIVIERGQPVLLSGDQIRAHCQKHSWGESTMLATSWLGVPLIAADTVFGAIVIQSYNDKVVFDHADVDLLTFVSNNISHAIKRYEDKLEKQRNVQQLTIASRQDTLTGLYNRAAFKEVLELACKQMSSNHLIAVLFIDLDGFKQVNDTHGHAIGDAVLIEIASTISKEVRTCDTVCRMGGDEFVIMLPEITHAEFASEVALRIIHAVAAVKIIDDCEVSLGASIGIAVSGKAEVSADMLINRADSAMYDIKRHGKNNFSMDVV